MTTTFLIRDMFKLANNVTVLACEGNAIAIMFAGRAGRLQAGNQIRQSITLTGQREMLNLSTPKSLKAIETGDVVNLTVEEAQSGSWSLLID
jgi:hypothetical protein